MFSKHFARCIHITMRTLQSSVAMYVPTGRICSNNVKTTVMKNELDERRLNGIFLVICWYEQLDWIDVGENRTNVIYERTRRVICGASNISYSDSPTSGSDRIWSLLRFGSDSVTQSLFDIGVRNGARCVGWRIRSLSWRRTHSLLPLRYDKRASCCDVGVDG